jgi:putative polyhydroxyalkanoate system protein
VSQISIRRAHKLAPEAARERVEHLAAKLTERFGARCRWEGDRLSIERDGVHGHVALPPGEIVIEARLGLAMGLLRGTIESEITRLLDREIGP